MAQQPDRYGVDHPPKHIDDDEDLGWVLAWNWKADGFICGDCCRRNLGHIARRMRSRRARPQDHQVHEALLAHLEEIAKSDRAAHLNTAARLQALMNRTGADWDDLHVIFDAWVHAYGFVIDTPDGPGFDHYAYDQALQDAIEDPDSPAL